MKANSAFYPLPSISEKKGMDLFNGWAEGNMVYAWTCPKCLVPIVDDVTCNGCGSWSVGSTFKRVLISTGTIYLADERPE